MTDLREMSWPFQNLAREEWPGHDVWGNEVGKFEEVADG